MLLKFEFVMLSNINQKTCSHHFHRLRSLSQIENGEVSANRNAKSRL